MALLEIAAASPVLAEDGAYSTDPAPPLQGAGYTVVEGRPGVVAGYVERPEAVAAVDPARRSAAPRRVCGWFDYEAENTFVPTPSSVLREGVTYLLACFDAGGGALVWADFRTWDEQQPGGGVVTTTAEVVAYARSLFELSPPAVETAPPAAAGVVGVDTWLGHPRGAVAPQVRVAQAGPLWASAEATPVAVRYEVGDGRPPLLCRPVPGPPDPDGAPPACARLSWRFQGTYDLAATVTYEISVTTGDTTTGTVTGPALVDTVDGPAAVTPIGVRELEAVIR